MGISIITKNVLPEEHKTQERYLSYTQAVAVQTREDADDRKYNNTKLENKCYHKDQKKFPPPIENKPD
jgi:hypothetical protein